MRGRILQYNGNDGQGIISADGQQNPFTISTWKSDTAPIVGKAVDVVILDGKVHAVMLVPDDVLMKEKTAELTGKLGSFVGELGSGLAKAGSTAPQGSFVGFYGRNLLIAYGLFLLGTLVFNAITISFLGNGGGKPLFELASLASQFGGGSGIKMLLLLSYAGFVVPYFWRDKRGWLLLLLPVVVVLYALWTSRKAFGGGGNGGGGDMVHLGIGAYLTIVSAGYLGLAGSKRFLTA